MSITEADVRHVASLARVGLDEARIPALVTELNGILGHMEALQQVHLLPEADAIHSVRAMPMRDDVVQPVPLARAREAFAPAMRDGFFLVPRLATHGAQGAAGAAPDELDDA